MTDKNYDIEKILSQTSFRDLSTEEQNRIWERISVIQQKPSLLLIFKKPMFTSILIALLLSIGVGGTVVTADNAAPGDTLFGIDRAVENLRLNLAGNEKKNELRIKFADERVREIEKINPTDTKPESLSSDDKIKVNLGINAALALLNGVSASLEGDEALRLKAITDELNSYLDSLPDDIQTEVRLKNDDDKTRIDLRTEDGRVRVEIKNGELRIKSDGDDKNRGWDDSDDKDDDDSDDRSGDDSNSSLEIEADIFTNDTVVKIEINDRKTTFTTDADTRAEIIAVVLVKYPMLTSAQVEAVLEVETEDRPSLIKDVTDLHDDDSDEDSDDDSDDDDDDSDDDHSGRGRGGDDDEEDDN